MRSIKQGTQLLSVQNQSWPRPAAIKDKEFVFHVAVVTYEHKANKNPNYPQIKAECFKFVFPSFALYKDNKQSKPVETGLQEFRLQIDSKMFLCIYIYIQFNSDIKHLL